MTQGHSCSTACGVFPNQGSNPCLLQSRADSFTAEPSRKRWPFLQLLCDWTFRDQEEAHVQGSSLLASPSSSVFLGHCNATAVLSERTHFVSHLDAFPWLITSCEFKTTVTISGVSFQPPLFPPLFHKILVSLQDPRTVIAP